MPPMLQVTLWLPHDPDVEAKVGRLVLDVLVMGGRVCDIFPAPLRPAPALLPAVTPSVGDLVAAGETPLDAAVGGPKPRRGASGNNS